MSVSKYIFFQRRASMKSHEIPRTSMEIDIKMFDLYKFVLFSSSVDMSTKDNLTRYQHVSTCINYPKNRSINVATYVSRRRKSCSVCVGTAGGATAGDDGDSAGSAGSTGSTGSTGATLRSNC